MYRQVALSREAKDLHRILWRDSPGQPLKHLRMTRVKYGTTSASYHSIRCLQETAKEASDEVTKLTIKRDFYVDDLLSGA